MCQVCYQKCWKYIVKHDEAYTEFRKSGNNKEDPIPDNLEELELSKSNSANEKDKLIEIKNIVQEYGAHDAGKISFFKQQVDKKFCILVQVMLKEARIPLKYLPIICSTAKEIHLSVQPNAMISENMNISEHLRIKCFHADQEEISFKI